MKKLIRIYPILLVLFSFGCNNKEYEVEDKLYQCMVEHYTDNNINLDVEMLDFENLLIEEEILTSKSGKSYTKLYNDIIDHNFDLMLPQNFEKFFTVNYNDINFDYCLNDIDSSIIKQSKYYELNKAILEYSIHQSTTEFSSIFQVYQSVITPQDYEHPFYKTKVLLSVLYTSNVEAGIPKNITVD